jgi:hypothetical protein
MKRLWFGTLKRRRPGRVFVSREMPTLIPGFPAWEIERERGGRFELLTGEQSGKMALFATQTAIRC